MLAKFAATVAAAAVLVTGAGVTTATASTPKATPLTVALATQKNWTLLLPTIEGTCSKLWLTRDQKFFIQQRNSTPSSECPDFSSQGKPPNSVTVSKIVGDNGGAPELRGLIFPKRQFTWQQISGLVQKQLGVNATNLREIAPLVRPYVRP